MGGVEVTCDAKGHGQRVRPERAGRHRGVVRTYLVDVGGVEVAHARVDAQVEDADLDAGLALARAVQVVVDVVHHLHIPLKKY